MRLYISFHRETPTMDQALLLVWEMERQVRCGPHPRGAPQCTCREQLHEP